MQERRRVGDRPATAEERRYDGEENEPACRFKQTCTPIGSSVTIVQSFSRGLFLTLASRYLRTLRSAAQAHSALLVYAASSTPSRTYLRMPYHTPAICQVIVGRWIFKRCRASI